MNLALIDCDSRFAGGSIAPTTGEALRPCPFDLGNLLARCVDDREFCALVLHKFSQRAADQISAIDRAAASGNGPELAVRAHTLKGVAANLAAEDLATAAAELEILARGNDHDRLAESVARVRAELQRAVELVPDVIERVLGGG